MSNAEKYSIADLSHKFNVSLRTLRFYEERGLIHPDRVGSTRIYSVKDAIRLEIILKGKRLGFSLKEIELFIISNNLEENGSEVVPFTAAENLPLSVIQDKISQLSSRLANVLFALEELYKAQEALGYKEKVA